MYVKGDDVETWLCAVCSVEFDTNKGGLCSKCNKPFCWDHIYILQGFVLDKSSDLRCQEHETRKRVKSLKNSVNPLDHSLTVKRIFT